MHYAAVEPIVQLILCGNVHGKKFRVGTDFQRKIYPFALFVDIVGENVPRLFGGSGRKPVGGRHGVHLAVHRHVVRPFRQPQKHRKTQRRHQQRSQHHRPRHGFYVAFGYQFGRVGAWHGVVQFGSRLGKMPRDSAQLLCVGAYHAPFPLGNDVAGNVERGGKLVLTFAAAFAGGCHRFAEGGHIVTARVALLLRLPQQLFQRNAQFLRYFAQQSEIRHGNAPFPLGNGLKVNAQPVGKLLLRYAGRFPQAF